MTRVPRPNATIERIFSITNVLWTDEITGFYIPTIEAIMVFNDISVMMFMIFL